MRRYYLKGGQAKLDVNKDGKISGEDFAMLRNKKKKKNSLLVKIVKKILPLWKFFWLQCKETLLKKEQIFFLRQD